ncbi:hypothetical protein BH10BAC2_BH10BAC2_33280 [soil metagenome]
MYFEFGHASLMLIVIMLLAYLTAIVFVVLYLVRNKNRSTMNGK